MSDRPFPSFQVANLQELHHGPYYPDIVLDIARVVVGESQEGSQSRDGRRLLPLDSSQLPLGRVPFAASKEVSAEIYLLEKELSLLQRRYQVVSPQLEEH